jgi:hypothetical protein
MTKVLSHVQWAGPEYMQYLFEKTQQCEALHQFYSESTMSYFSKHAGTSCTVEAKKGFVDRLATAADNVVNNRLVEKFENSEQCVIDLTARSIRAAAEVNAFLSKATAIERRTITMQLLGEEERAYCEGLLQGSNLSLDMALKNIPVEGTFGYLRIYLEARAAPPPPPPIEEDENEELEEELNNQEANSFWSQ